MNALDTKIDSMVKRFATDYSDISYNELNYSVNQMLRVMSRAHVIKFLKYAESLKAGN
jgi:hypothetical protein